MKTDHPDFCIDFYVELWNFNVKIIIEDYKSRTFKKMF